MNERRVFFDLRSPGLLGKRPIIGLMIFVIGSMIFIILAYNLIKQGPLIQWDLLLAESLHALALNSSAFVINIMIIGSYLGLQGSVGISVILAVYFLYKRFWRELVMGVAALGGSGLLFIFLSHAFNRPRPFLSFDKLIWLSSPNIPGFPSGHASGILVLCGFLVYLLVPKIKSYLGKVLVITIALLVMFYVGFSRLYLGDHYLTDILAGYAVGFAWLGFSFTAVEFLFQRFGRGDKSYEKRTKGYNKN